MRSDTTLVIYQLNENYLWYHKHLANEIKAELKDMHKYTSTAIGNFIHNKFYRDWYINYHELSIDFYTSTSTIDKPTQLDKIDANHAMKEINEMPPKLRKLIDKLIKLEHCQMHLNTNYSPNDKIHAFAETFKRFAADFSEHRDSPAWHYIKNICLILSSCLGNLGFAKAKFGLFSRGHQFRIAVESRLNDVAESNSSRLIEPTHNTSKL